MSCGNANIQEDVGAIIQDKVDEARAVIVVSSEDESYGVKDPPTAGRDNFDDLVAWVGVGASRGENVAVDGMDGGGI